MLGSIMGKTYTDILRHAVVRTSHSAADCANGIGVAANRDRVADRILKGRGLEKRLKRLRHGALA